LPRFEANDLDGLLRNYISPDADTTRRRAAWALGRIEVDRINYHNLRITINRLTSPITAEAEFDGSVSFRDRRGEFPYNNYAARFKLELELRDGRWLVTGHEERDALGVRHEEDRY